MRVCGFSPFRSICLVSTRASLQYSTHRMSVSAKCLYSISISIDLSIPSTSLNRSFGSRKCCKCKRSEMKWRKKTEIKIETRIFQACPNRNIRDWRRIARRVTAAAATGEERRNSTLPLSHWHTLGSCNTQVAVQYSRRTPNAEGNKSLCKPIQTSYNSITSRRTDVKKPLAAHGDSRPILCHISWFFA